MGWSSNSPNLNPMENFWRVMKYKEIFPKKSKGARSYNRINLVQFTKKFGSEISKHNAKQIKESM